VFGADPEHGVRSRLALEAAITAGAVIACPIVWAEVVPFFASVAAATSAMADAEVGFAPLEREVALLAGAAWGAYRRAGGARERLTADFLIGAHATAAADRLLTRDRGFYRRYFPALVVIDPAAAGPAAGRGDGA